MDFDADFAHNFRHLMLYKKAFSGKKKNANMDTNAGF
jgi:hypothetical protein